MADLRRLYRCRCRCWCRYRYRYRCWCRTRCPLLWRCRCRCWCWCWVRSIRWSRSRCWSRFLSARCRFVGLSECRKRSLCSPAPDRCRRRVRTRAQSKKRQEAGPYASVDGSSRLRSACVRLGVSYFATLQNPSDRLVWRSAIDQGPKNTSVIAGPLLALKSSMARFLRLGVFYSSLALVLVQLAGG
ncbi:MAG TPA: hypothetical protein ENJ18_05815 [Nannocystis exedens]|nr:hypothetical protein [Nannocystis exedens]